MLRFLDPAEHYFWILDQVSSMNFVVIAELKQTFNSKDFEQALSVLQAQLTEEAIFNLVVQSTAEGRLYFETHQDSISLETLNSRQAAHKVLAKYLPQKFTLDEPLVRAFYINHSQQNRSSIALMFNHAIADGKTGMALLRRWLDLHAEVLSEQAGSIISTPSLACQQPLLQANAPLHQLLPTYFTLSANADSNAPQVQLSELLEQRKNDLRRFGRPDALTLTNSQPETSQPETFAIELDTAQLQQLQQACKRAKCSVHGALMAAQLLTIKQLETDDENRELTLCLTSPVDLRRFFADKHHDIGMYTSLVSSAYRIGSNTDFWSLAQQASKEIKLQLERGDASHFYHLAGTTDIPLLPEAMAQFKVQILKSAPQSLISNIGVIPDTGLDYVQQLSFALCPIPSQPIFTAVTSYKGVLRLNITHDQSQTQPEVIQLLVENMKQRLLESCFI